MTANPEIAVFLAGLPPERRRDFERVRDVILKSIPDGYEEVVSRRMLVYQVPFERYSTTYNGHPLWYLALASEKAYLSLHLMSIYANVEQERRLESGFRAAGKKLKRGKACIRFQTADDLALDVIADLVAGIPVDTWVEIAESARRGGSARRSSERDPH